jgi:hypothetical protein
MRVLGVGPLSFHSIAGAPFEFPERLEFLEIGCDDPHLEVAALVCNLPLGTCAHS